MLKFIDLIPLVDSFLIGDVNTDMILPPEAVAYDEVIYAEVSSITAKDGFPVLWLNLKEE